ncbi:Protein of unknown function DUF3505 [Kalmanozyma brasiliensis GHG001]|uniref:Protein of unknown function DUF3505 n=1 Tax=Kalmanozyma brasiliensis (strain GHG001) TaxID=1365824 RepID=UPI002867BCC8|nr:Protein of unknown function DUF3505 [Kalmanozyma brasiliensis GHG001]KAF6767244.1 Protein of unknown function DUF3505 [Kalmanozyma brasiliensis GHG001]
MTLQSPPSVRSDSADNADTAVNAVNTVEGKTVSTSLAETPLLPAANQLAANAAGDAAAQAPNAATAITSATLGRFYLRLVDHPQLLVCTRVGCTLGVPLTPLFRDVTAHVQRFHHQPLGDASRRAIQAMLDQLDLPLPKDVPVDHDQLPVPKIKELPVVTDGYQCSHCSYAIFARNAMSAHVKDKHADLKVKAKPTHPVLLQVIQEHGKNKRYIYVQDKELDPTPPQAILNANLDARQLDNAITARAAAFIQQDQAALRDAGLLNPVVDASMLSGNIGPWAKQLKWRSYWAGKPLAAIGALGMDTSSWPGAHHDFVHWLARMAKASAQRWMQTFMESGRYMQQTFHAYSDEPSEPYC